jgi:ribonuclease-3
MSELHSASAPFAQKFNYRFRNDKLLHQALTHKSAHYESPEASPGHNEKLEFLGDAVLDLVLSAMLLEAFPADTEGNLSKKRASLVNETVLHQVALELAIPDVLRLGKGEAQSGGSLKPRLLASAFEALVGALFLDGGYEPAERLVRQSFARHLLNWNSEADFKDDYKTRLQEEVQKLFRSTPSYELEKEEGPAHDRVFHVKLVIRKKLISRGSGKSKRQAEQEAARLALEGKLYE